MKRYLFIFFAAFWIGHAAANITGGTVSGKIITAEQKPVEFAVVTLLKASDSSLVKGALTNSEGKFTLEDLPAGEFFISASCAGYTKKQELPFELGENQAITVADIMLEAVKEMAEVAIVASQPLFVQKPGMLVMNVENSPVRLSGTAYDLVKAAPGVFIDQNGNISLKGKSGVRVYIDGKNLYLAGEQLQNYLLTIPAQDIVRVEIITNPSAKYDAEGNAGIINLVTQKGSRQGLNASVYGGGALGKLPRSFAGVNFNYGKPKYNIYGKYDFGTPWRIEDHQIRKSVTYEGLTSYYTQRTLITFNPYVHVLRFGVDFTPRPKTTWGIRLDGSRDAENISTDNHSVITQPDSGTTTLLNQVNRLHGRFNNAGAGAYLKHEFDSSGAELSFAANWLLYYDRTNETYDLVFTDGNNNPIGAPLFQRSKSGSDIGIYVFQADYAQPFAKKYKLETGLKTSYVKTANELVFELEENGSWIYDSTRSNTFTYIEQISAAYVNGSASFDRWEIMAGLRGEYTISDGNSPTMDQEVRLGYFELFPSAFITWKANRANAFGLSLTRRINRPDYQSLNPFLFYIDQFTYKAGNPFLQSEIAWNAEVTYSYNNFLFLSAGYSRTTEAMTDISRQVDSTGIIYQTTVNLDTVLSMYAGATVSYDIAKWWTMDVNFNTAYARYRSDLYGASLDNHKVSFSADASETFLLKDGWKIQVSGFYRSKMYYGMFLFQPMGGVDMAVSKNFLANKLQCSVGFRDIFHTQILNLDVNFDQQDIHVHHISDSQVVTVRMRYNFGNAKAARKSEFKNGADDLQERAG
jgi:iron complex outermembrane recepter protein